MHPARTGQRIRLTDPMAFMVDWRLVASRPTDSHYSEDDRYPAAVIKFEQGRLVPCDAGGETGELQGEPPLASLPPNNKICLYELPTAWTRIGRAGEQERGVGTFRDVTALVDANAEGANFSDLAVTQPGRAYLVELGINALETFLRWLSPSSNRLFPETFDGLVLSGGWRAARARCARACGIPTSSPAQAALRRYGRCAVRRAWCR